MPNILEVKTIHAIAFKTVFESLKEFLTDANIEFTLKSKSSEESKGSRGGIKIKALNSKKTLLIHLTLDSDNFEKFHCSKQKYTIGINMISFFKIIKTVDSSSLLTLYIEEESVNKLCIKIERQEKKQITNYKLALMDIDNDPIVIDPIELDAKISLPSNDFCKICKDLQGLTEYVQFHNINKTLCIKGSGDITEVEIVLGEFGNGITINRNETSDQIIEGKYELNNIITFAKCTNLSPTIDIYLKNDYPLILHYQVASLGDMYLCLTPIAE